MYFQLGSFSTAWLGTKSFKPHKHFSGDEARSVFSDAQRLLKEIKSAGSLRAVGSVAFYKAQSNGDDINLYDDTDNNIAKLHGLRQQVRLY